MSNADKHYVQRSLHVAPPIRLIDLLTAVEDVPREAVLEVIDDGELLEVRWEQWIPRTAGEPQI